MTASNAAVTNGLRLRTGLWLYFLLLGCSLIGSLLLRDTSVDEADVDITLTVAFAAIVSIWTAGTWRTLRPILSSWSSWRWCGVGVVVGLGTFVVATLFIEGLVAWMGIEKLSYSPPLLEGGYGWLTVILTVCVCPAVFEELAFRGVIFESLRGIMGVREIVIVSALMFMILHLAPLNFPHLAIVGLALGILRVRSGGLYPCIVAHFTHNLLVILEEMRALT